VIRDGLIAVLLGLLIGACIASNGQVDEPPHFDEPPPFEATLARLAYWAPPTVEWRVELTEFSDAKHKAYLGLAYKGWHGRWMIQICSRHEATTVRDTLVHEWAHVLRNYGGSQTQTSHDAYWGVAYAEAYRASQTPLPKEEDDEQEEDEDHPEEEGHGQESPPTDF
jgi:hypothetical protein